MNQKVKLIISAVVFVGVIGICGFLYQSLSEGYSTQNEVKEEGITPEPSAADSGETEKVEAPDFSVEDVEGNVVKLSDFKGKPVVLNFWASWCPPCKSEMPDFDKVWKELGEDVAFLMLNMTDGQRETKKKADKFIAEKGFSFPVYYDVNQEAAYTYGISSIPVTYFIDKDGYVVTGSMGAMDEETLRSNLELIQ